MMLGSLNSFTIIVIDDGSTDGTFEYIKAYYPSIVVLKGNGNLWWTGATNAGVREALKLSTNTSDYILTLNNDLIVDSNYLQELLKCAGANKRTIVGSVSVNIDKPNEISFAGVKWNSKSASYRPLRKEYPSYDLLSSIEYLSTDLLPGRGTLIPISAFKEIGLFDEESFPQYMADEDFSYRCKMSGYKLIIAPKARVYSHVMDKGLNKIHKKKSVQYYREVFTSLRSPNNFRIRWSWAKKHATIPAPLYFIIDMLRITKGILSNHL